MKEALGPRVLSSGTVGQRVLAPAAVVDQLGEVLTTLAGVVALNALALEVGVQWSIFEPDEPGDNPLPGQFVPGMFGQ